MKPILSADVQCLPVGHLQLPRPIRLALARSGIHTLGGLAASFDDPKGIVHEWTSAKAEKLERAYQAFIGMLDASGQADWASFWRNAPPEKDALYCTSAALQRITAQSRAIPVGSLGVLAKTMMSLDRVKITTLGELLDAAAGGLEAWKAAGKVVILDLHKNLRVLSAAVQEDGSIDWESYAAANGIPLLPASAQQQYSGADFIRELPGLLKQIFAGGENKREWQILEKRMLTPYEEKLTLQELADCQPGGLTRERIRQNQVLITQRLRNILLHENYTGFRFRIRRRFLEPLRQLQAAASQTMTTELTLPQWQKVAVETWGSVPSESPILTQFLPELFGWQLIEFSQRGVPPLYVAAGLDEKRYLTVIEQIWELLYREHPQGMDAVSLSTELRKKLGSATPLPQEMPKWLALVPELDDTAPGGIIRLKIHRLKRGDQAERVLLAAGKEMHARDICRELNRLTAGKTRGIEIRNLVGQMGNDPRFSPIGKSGRWILKNAAMATQVDVRAWTDIAESVLHARGESMGETELIAEAEKRRPGSAKSLTSLLSQDKRFRRSGYGRWGLAVWGATTFANDWSHQRIEEWVKAYFKESRQDWTLAANVRKAFMAATGFQARQATSILLHSGALDRRTEGYKRYVSPARYPKANRELLAESRGQRSVPRKVLDAVLGEIKTLLMAQPSREMLMRDIVAKLAQRGHSSTRVYWVVNECVGDVFEKFTTEEDGPIHIALSGTNLAQYPQLNKLRDPATRAEAERAIRKLTLDDVDLGLFMLGRLFEASMREFIRSVAASRLSKHPVEYEDTKDLRSMVDWMLRNGFFKDARAADQLRRHRNERAHGAANLQERLLLVRNANETVNRFLAHIVIIDEMSARLRHVLATSNKQ